MNLEEVKDWKYKKVKSTVSGFKGTVSAKIEYANGCVQLKVTPPVGKDGKYIDSRWIDIQSLVYVPVRKEVVAPPSNRGGADRVEKGNGLR